MVFLYMEQFLSTFFLHLNKMISDVKRIKKGKGVKQEHNLNWYVKNKIDLSIDDSENVMECSSCTSLSDCNCFLMQNAFCW